VQGGFAVLTTYRGGFRAFRYVVIPAWHVFRAFFFFFNGCHWFPLLKNVHLHFQASFFFLAWHLGSHAFIIIIIIIIIIYRNVAGLLRIVAPQVGQPFPMSIPILSSQLVDMLLVRT
jgi:hypothetical protein